MGHFNPGHSCQKPQFKSVTDNCFIPHTCLGVTTAEMPLLKLHLVTPQGETCLGCILHPFWDSFIARVSTISKMGFHNSELCIFIGLVHLGFYIQSMSRWEGDEVGGREGRGGSYTESHRRESCGHALARDKAALVDKLQEWMMKGLFYLWTLICVPVKLVYGSSLGFQPQGTRSCIMESTHSVHSLRHLLNDHTVPFTVPGSGNIETNEAQCLTLRSSQSNPHYQEFNSSCSLACTIIHSASTLLSVRHYNELVGGDTEIQRKKNKVLDLKMSPVE